MSRSIDDFQGLLNDAYRFLSVRARSRQEMIAYLEKRSKKKNADPTVGARVLSRLEEMDYINDETFSRDWINARAQAKGFGQIKLKQELKQKGISAEIIFQAISTSPLLNEESQTDSAKKALEKRVMRWQQLPTLYCKRKVYDFLVRRGFSSTIALGLVDEYCPKAYNTGCENNN